MNSPVLQSAGLFNFHSSQVALTTVGLLLEMRKKERSVSNRKEKKNKEENKYTI